MDSPAVAIFLSVLLAGAILGGAAMLSHVYVQRARGTGNAGTPANLIVMQCVGIVLFVGGVLLLAYLL
jgi:hypothetical protein